MYDEPFDMLDEAQAAAAEFFGQRLSWVPETEPLKRWWTRAYGDQGAEIGISLGRVESIVVTTGLVR